MPRSSASARMRRCCCRPGPARRRCSGCCLPRGRSARSMRSSSARSRCAPGASTSSWSRSHLRRWPTTSSTTRRSAAAPTASISTQAEPAARRAPRSRPAAARSTPSRSPAWSRRSAFSRCCCARASAVSLAGIRINEQRMRATGFSTYPTSSRRSRCGRARRPRRLPVRGQGRLRQPGALGWHLSGAVLMMVILGGIGRLRGAVIGAFAFALLQELFQSEAVFGGFAKHWQLALGLADHRQRGAAAERPRRPARAAARAARSGSGRLRRRRSSDDAA